MVRFLSVNVYKNAKRVNENTHTTKQNTKDLKVLTKIISVVYLSTNYPFLLSVVYIGYIVDFKRNQK